MLLSTVGRAMTTSPRRSRYRHRALPAVAVLALVASLFAGVPARSVVAATTDPPSPVVAIHVSEHTAALETMTAKAPTPTGSGTSGKEWWITSWRYFVAYQSLEEALKSDGTPYVEVSDSDIATGKLLTTDGLARYPIVISLAAEAIADVEIAPLRDYVSAGGFLLVGSSSFTRNTNGTTRGNFALHAEMGLHMTNASLQNWTLNNSFAKTGASRLTADIPSGGILWSGKESYDTTAWSNDARWVWQAATDDAQVLATGDGGVELATKAYGNGRFIYDAELQPLLGDTGYSSSTFAYTIYRRAVEWAFEAAGMPIVKVSPWRYPYDAAGMVRHDLETGTYPGSTILQSAQYEQSLGMKGDYYFTTGTLRISPTNPDTRMSDANKRADIDKLRLAASDYGATVGSHNGGLPNPAGYPTDPRVNDFWHWGPDQALDTSPTGYASGADYARQSLQTSFQDIETWMSSSPYAGAAGLTAVDNGRTGCGAAGICPSTFVSPYHNAGREGSHQILSDLGAQVVGEQKVGPFPVHDFSYLAPHTYFSMVGMGVGNWYIGGTLYDSLDAYLGTTDMQAAVDWYYNLGGLVNLYGHSDLRAYVSYLAGKPNLWKTNAVGVRDWFLKREPVKVTPSFTRSGSTSVATASVTGSTDSQTAVELVIPNWSGTTSTSVSILLNGAAAPAGTWRATASGVKIQVGTTVSSIEVRYDPMDTTPPLVTVPADMTVGATGPAGAVVTFTATATDNVDGALTPTCTPASGSTFPVGTTIVTCSATDQAGNTASKTFTVTVTAPVDVQSWTQTDWSGGAGQDVWSDPTHYQAGTNVDTSVPGQVSLGAATGGSVLFSDTFTRDPADPAPLSPWKSVGGSWTVAGGVLSGTGAYGSVWGYGNVYNVPPTSPPSDYAVDARVQLSAGSLGGGIGGRLNTTTGAHYGIWVYPPGGGAQNANHIALVKFSNWTSYSTPVSTALTIDANWHDLRVEFAGARIRAWLDGTQLIDYTDPSPLSGSGITIDTYPPGTISVDNVTMTTPVAFNSTGSLVASAFDAGAGSTWQALSWQAATPAGTTVRLRTRTAGISTGLAAATWSAWYAANGAPIPDPSGRWMQYEVSLGTSNTAITPFLYDVTATFYGTPPLDTTPPVVSVPADVSVPATIPAGATVTFAATATDNVDGALTPTCTPASGSTFPVGSTTVTCSATDKAGNTGSDSFSVTVDPYADAVDPVVTVPADITAEATSPTGAAVTFSASAVDDIDGPLTPICSPASGSTFALGATTITCTATDAAGNTGSASFSVTVVDTTPPAVTVPADVSVPATTPAGATVTFTATATDNVDGALTPTCTPASGSTFPVGTTIVTCSATDQAGNTASKTFTVTVTAPVDEAPVAPAGLTAKVSTVAVVLDWDNNTEPDLAGYLVYRSSASDGPWTKLTSVPITTSAYTDTSAPTGSKVYYRVTAVDVAGHESPTASTSATRTIAFRSASFAQNGGATTLVIPRPAGMQPTDIMVAVITVRGVPAITPPSGWTLIRTDTNGTALKQATYFCVVDGTPGASFAWTFSGSNPLSGAIVAYSGVDISGSPIRPVDASNGRVTTSSTISIVAPSITTSVDGDLLIGAFGSATSATFTPPSGMIEQGEIASTSGKTKVATEVADQVLGAAGSTGNRTATADKSAVVIGQLIALRPAGTAPAPDTEKPTPPTSLVATATSPMQVDLTWTASTDNVRVDHYVVERAIGAGDFASIGTSTLTRFADTTVSQSTTYRYRVMAVDPTGNTSDPSGMANVTTPAPPVTSAILFRGASQGANRVATSLVLARPSATQPADTLVASIDVRGTPTVVPPGGWELVRTDVAGADLTKATYWHLVGANEPGSYVWTFSVASVASGVLVAYGGVDNANPIEVSAGQANPSGITITAPPVSASSAGSMLIAFFGSATNATFTPPIGMAERGDVAATSGSLKVASEAADAVLPGTDPTGVRTATASKAAVSIGQLIVLRPAP